ncbi:MAG: hypothetical protein M3229_03965 [Actinomycetota bacterium]|nr:hypothetical protein [Actinomycetota bacterium]
MPDRVRVEIGFDGGQGIAALVSLEQAEELEQALAAGSDGVIKLDAEDGHYTVALHRVVFVRRFARESRVGFGGVEPPGATRVA